MFWVTRDWILWNKFDENEVYDNQHIRVYRYNRAPVWNKKRKGKSHFCETLYSLLVQTEAQHRLDEPIWLVQSVDCKTFLNESEYMKYSNMWTADEIWNDDDRRITGGQV